VEKWKVEKWKVGSGKWEMEGGRMEGWKAEMGKWEVEGGLKLFIVANATKQNGEADASPF